MKHKVLVLILTVCLFASIVLAFLPVEQICGIKSGCEAVQSSQYKDFLGVNNGYLGILAFFILLTLTISHIKAPRKYKHALILIGISIGSLIALFFIYLQIFVIKAFCTYCLVVDIGMILGLILIFPRKKKAE
ncbi:vitamin K epoxide reductase family protein [archaeon]|nr:vitamin K epoxide reductase family protein [archaeon]PJC45619.1 MAG: hypothetical protein CO037_00560 [Candidatus Pacearchaeota archaeon CG_4_9_14_0_2_um_filter_30_8]